MGLLYLLALFISIGGLGLLDWRYRLAFFADAGRTLRVLGVGLALFVAWDLAGIDSGIFLAGDSRYATGIFLAPHFPLEELFFLVLLVYLPLVTWQGVKVWHQTT